MQIIFNLLLENGVKYSDIILLERLYLVLLLIPIVATIIGIARYVIGIRSINFYTPLFATFILFDISNTSGMGTNFMTGLKYGLLFFLCVFVTSTIFYKLLKRLRMHYIPKLSLIITATSVSIAILIATMLYFEKTLPLEISPFLFIALIVSAEGFMSVYAKKNFRYIAGLAFESLIIAIISYTVISIPLVQQFVLNNPWIIIIITFINLYVGRFLGLRLNEYWRFRSILINREIRDEQNKPNSK